MKTRIVVLLTVFIIFGLLFVACIDPIPFEVPEGASIPGVTARTPEPTPASGDPSNPAGSDITAWLNLSANGSTTQTTTELTLTFKQTITGLSAADITLSGVSGVKKGTLSGSGPAYNLPISGFSSGGTLSVKVEKSGYTFSGSPKTVTIYVDDGNGITVTLNSVTANGSSTQTTTQLTLTFSETVTGLSAGDITLSGVSGVSKGTLSGSGSTYTLPISGFSSSGTLSVAVAKSGYTVSGSPKTVPIYFYNSDDPVISYHVRANGSSLLTTTELILSFTDVITGLSAADITLSGVSGVSKGTLSGSGTVYYLPISGFTSSDTLTVTISKQGYIINPLSTTVDIFYPSLGGGNSSLIAEWHNSQENADSYSWQTPVYRFTADGDFYHNGESYYYSATNNNITILPYYGTADYSINGTKLTLSNVTGNILMAGDYYKKRESASFNSVTANGSVAQTTTQLTLTFDKPILGLTANDITLSGVSGVSKGTLSSSGTDYTLPISGFTSGGTLSVAVENSAYAINGSPKTVSIFYVGEVTFTGLTANGSSTQTTTQLTLTFDNPIPGLSAADITLSGVSGVSKGTLSGSGPTYTLGISGVTAGGTLNVAVAKSGYSISGSLKTVTIYYTPPTAVTFSSLTANGSSSQTTTQLTLTFSEAITGLSAADITLSGVSGVSKGTLSGSGPTYTLGISGFSSGGTLTVAVSKSGYTINSSRTVTIYYYSAPTTYTVTYVSNGGSSVSSQTANLGTQITLPSTTRTGYNFVGWFSAATGGTKAGFAGDRFVAVNNVTLHAQWANATTGMPWESYTVTTLQSNTTYTSGTLSNTFDNRWYRVTISGSTTNPVPIVRIRDKNYGSSYTGVVRWAIYDVLGNQMYINSGTQLANSWPSGTGIYYISVFVDNYAAGNVGSFGINFSH